MFARAAAAAARACTRQAARAHATAAGGAPPRPPSPALQALVDRVRAATPADPLSTGAGGAAASPEPELWDAIRLGRGGGALQAVRLSAASLGLAPRDAGLFSRPASGSGPGALPGQRATLVTRRVRADEGSGGCHRGLILLRTEAVRAAIGADEAFIFPCRRERDTEVVLANVLEAVRAAAAASATTTPAPAAAGGAPPNPAQPSPPPSSSSSRLPFELAVLEACLAETVRQFERRHRQLRLVADGVADDVRRALRGGGGGDEGGGSGGMPSLFSSASSSGAPPEVGRLLPIAIALQEVRHDVREAAAAVSEVADSDAAVAAVCLSDHEHGGEGGGTPAPSHPHPPPHAHVAAAVLEAYERQIETVASAIRELEENTASLHSGELLGREREGMETRTHTKYALTRAPLFSLSFSALAIGLDSHRNSLMSLNAHMTILSASVAVCALPAAWFGMNLTTGLEGTPGVFWPLVGWSATAAACLGGGVWLGWRRWPRAAAAARAADLQALRDLLLYHLDDVEDILAITAAAARQAPDGDGGDGGGGGALSREAFHAAVAAAFKNTTGGGARPIAPDELDIIYGCVDADRDGFLRTSELAAAAVGGGERGRGWALRVEK